MSDKNALIIAASVLILGGSAYYAVKALHQSTQSSNTRIDLLSQQASSVAEQFSASRSDSAAADSELKNSMQSAGSTVDSVSAAKTAPVSSHEEAETDLSSSSSEAKNVPTVITDEMVHQQKIIFVGDSRTVGMGYAEYDLGDECIYIGESGEGFTWFIETGLEILENTLHDHPDLPVVYNLGVNDTESINEYIDLYQTIEKEWNETDFYYLSVNPIESDELNVTNRDIITFNRRLKKVFTDHYIDSYTWMKDAGFDTVDGLHYTEEQYCQIHDFASRAILELVSSR